MGIKLSKALLYAILDARGETLDQEIARMDEQAKADLQGIVAKHFPESLFAPEFRKYSPGEILINTWSDDFTISYDRSQLLKAELPALQEDLRAFAKKYQPVREWRSQVRDAIRKAHRLIQSHTPKEALAQLRAAGMVIPEEELASVDAKLKAKSALSVPNSDFSSWKEALA